MRELGIQMFVVTWSSGSVERRFAVEAPDKTGARAAVARHVYGRSYTLEDLPYGDHLAIREAEFGEVLELIP